LRYQYARMTWEVCLACGSKYWIPDGDDKAETWVSACSVCLNKKKDK